MSQLVPVMLVGWLVVAVGLFMWLPPRRAMITQFIAGWIFLPVGALMIQGLPEISKITTVALGGLLGAVFFDFGRLIRYQPHWVDGVVLAFCLVPVGTSLSNDLGLYDGLSKSFAHMMQWGIPFYLGRVYLTDLDAYRDLAVGIVIGGLICIPMCLWEMRVSPMLHKSVYGYHPFKFVSASRFGGYRPVGFFRHGIEMAMWMTSASLVSIWLWKTNRVNKFLDIPIKWVTASLVLVTVMCRSMGAIALFIPALAALFEIHLYRRAMVLVILLLIPVFYVSLRSSTDWGAAQLVEAAAIIDEDRAGSLNFRLYNDRQLVVKALDRPMLGWGAWGRNRAYNEDGEDISVTDGLWVIIVGQHGLIGLISWLGITLLPPALYVTRAGPKSLGQAALAPLTVACVLLGIHTIDWLMNAFTNPTYFLMAGGIVTIASKLTWVKGRLGLLD